MAALRAPKKLLLAVAFLAVVASASGSDEITSLPNYSGGELCFKHYSGYVDLANNKSLFYWYVEATEQPQEKPLVLWLNGGPGCSSLGGMFVEHGPFVLDKDLNVTLNPYSWNTVANMLYLEQPAGVGFSYPAGKTNDDITSADTHASLLEFLKIHSELKGRDFFIAGESYGGHYVPNVAKRILDEDAHPDAVMLKGIAVGNGYTDWQLDFNANVENGRFHALTSDAAFKKAQEVCDGNFARCFWPRDDVECPKDCDAAVQTAVENGMDGSIDIYDIYEDVCLDPSRTGRHTQVSRLLEERRRQLKKHSPAFQQQQQQQQQQKTQPSCDSETCCNKVFYADDCDATTNCLFIWSGKGEQCHYVGPEAAKTVDDDKRRLKGTTISPVFDTCIDHFNEAYLNLPQVQDAIHVRKGTVKAWRDCGGTPYDFNYASELPNYRDWIKSQPFDILIYNGDADFILSHMGNSAWITEGLNATVKEPWKKWRGSDRQVAGYFQVFDGLTFLTVKGAGHMVPKDRPRHALDMFTKFLAGGNAYDKVAPAGPTVPGLCEKRTGEEKKKGGEL